MKENNLNKGYSIYIDGKAKACRNVVGFINNSHPGSTKKLPNSEFVESKDNKVMATTIKSISTQK